MGGYGAAGGPSADHRGHAPKSGAYNIDMFGRILDWYDRRLRKPGQ
jgi:hypothetical protein